MPDTAAWTQDPELVESLKLLAMERVKTIPDDTELSVGAGVYSKDQLLTHIRKGDGIGNQIIEVQLRFLRDMASGAIFKDE